MAITREKFMEQLTASYPVFKLAMTEDFKNDFAGGIWVRNTEELNDLFDYWIEDIQEKYYIFGVKKSLHNWANKKGWYFEWYDAGTMMIWKI